MTPAQNLEPSIQVEDIEDESQEQIPESQRDMIKGIVFAKVRKHKPKKVKTESTTDVVRTQENEPSLKEEEMSRHEEVHRKNIHQEVVVEAIEDEEDETNELRQTYYKDLDGPSRDRPSKSKQKKEKRGFKKGEMVLANYLQ